MDSLWVLAEVMKFPSLWASMVLGIIWAGGYISPEAARKMTSVVMYKLMVLWTWVGSLGFIVYMLYASSLISSDRLYQAITALRMTVDGSAPWIALVKTTVREGCELWFSHALVRYGVVGFVGMVWGRLWRRPGKSDGKSRWSDDLTFQAQTG
jgi:hypothetical protein